MNSILGLLVLVAALPFSALAQPLNPADCRDATKKLNDQIELYEQLSQAFLQTNQTLADIYSTFSEKLRNSTPAENERIAEHFKKSGDELNRARAANEGVLRNLKEETERLKKQVAWCTGTPAEVRLFVSSVQLVQQQGRSVKVIYRATLGLCERPAGYKLIRDEAFGYRVEISASLTNCGVRNDRTKSWQEELEIGPLEPGRHELRFEDTPEGTYFSIPVDIRD